MEVLVTLWFPLFSASQTNQSAKNLPDCCTYAVCQRQAPTPPPEAEVGGDSEVDREESETDLLELEEKGGAGSRPCSVKNGGGVCPESGGWFFGR